jgi:hypothetical protein
MTTALSQQGPENLAEGRHHAAASGALIVVFWGIAALLVAIVHQRIDAVSPVESVVLKVAAILVIAAAYSRLAASRATLDHALLTGTTWVLLGIAAEIVITSRSGRQWFALLGSPANGGLRCVLLIAWLVAPALFIRNRK